MISHRLLRYASGLLHLALLATSLVLAFTRGGVYAVVLGLHVGVRALRAASIGAARARAGARAGGVLLAGHAGHAARARRRRARRARRVGTRGGHAMNAEGERVKRAIDVVGAAAGLALGAPRAGARGVRHQARGRRPGVLPAERLGADGEALRDAQAADDDGRRREDRAATASSRRATAASRASARCCGARRWTSCPSCGTSCAAT